MNNRNDILKQLITECIKVFPKTIKKEVTFHDANVRDHWGEEPPKEETYDEPWESWTELTDFDIVRGNWSGIFTYMDFDEVLFYIPAFMKYTLEDELLPKRTHDSDTVWESTFAFLGKNYDKLDSYKINDKQKEFIRKFIEVFLNSKDAISWLNIHRETRIENELNRTLDHKNGKL